MLTKNIIIGSAVVCAVAGLGAWAVLRGRAVVQYRTAPVERGDLSVTISATGNPNAVVTVQVGSQVSGIVMALYADFNTKVIKGQLIARIDPASFQTKVDQAQANLDAARAGAANGEAGVQKAQAGIQAANASLAAAKANVVNAQASALDDKSKADRRVTLASEGVISTEDLETAQLAYNKLASIATPSSPSSLPPMTT